jgi:hypothetical protein
MPTTAKAREPKRSAGFLTFWSTLRSGWQVPSREWIQVPSRERSILHVPVDAAKADLRALSVESGTDA